MLTAETSKLLPLDYNTFTNKLLVSLIKWFNKSNGSAQLCTEDDNPRGLYSRSFNVFSSFVSSVACLVLEIFPCPVQTVQKTRAWSSQTLSPPICNRKQIQIMEKLDTIVRWKEARRRREERTEEQSVTMRKKKKQWITCKAASALLRRNLKNGGPIPMKTHQMIIFFTNVFQIKKRNNFRFLFE